MNTQLTRLNNSMAQVYCRQSCSWSGAHAHEAVGEPLERTEHGVEPGAAMGVEHLHEVKAHGLRDRREGDDVEGELEPAGSLHKRLVKIFQDAPSR